MTAPKTIGGRAEAALLTATLAAPWFVHAAVVLASAVGARPLGSPAFASTILAAAVVFASVLGVKAFRVCGAGPATEPVSSVSEALSNGVCVAALSVFSISLFAALALPIIAYDALGYRLPAIAQWLDAGRIAWVVTDDPVRNGYPLGQEAIAAVLASAVGDARFTALPSFFCLAAGAAAIALCAESVGVRPRFSRLAAAVFLLVPMNVLNASSGYVDAAFGGVVVALFCNATLFVSAKKRETEFLFATTTGMAAALVLSLKGNGIAVVLVVAAGIAVTCLGRVLSARVRNPNPTQFDYVSGRNYRAWILAKVSALPGMFWLIRNVTRTRNPMWPVEIRIAGHTLFPGVATMDAVMDVAHNTPPVLARFGNPLRVAYTWLQLSGPAADFDDRLAGLGWAWPVLAMPAILAFLWLSFRKQNAEREWTNVLAVLVMTAVCFVIQPMKWWPRYTIWVWGGGALALAVVAERLARAKHEVALGVGLLVLSGLTIGEGANAAVHANGLRLVVERSRFGIPGLRDVKTAGNAAKWVRPEFWALGLADQKDVCRGAWKPGTDDANLDGVFAELAPRPRVHVVFDDHESWSQVKSEWRKTGCSELLLFLESPVLASAMVDPEVTLSQATAFDPLFVIRIAGLAD